MNEIFCSLPGIKHMFLCSRERVSIHAALNAAFLASWPGSLFTFSLSKRTKGKGARKPVNAIGLTHTRVRV